MIKNIIICLLSLLLVYAYFFHQNKYGGMTAEQWFFSQSENISLYENEKGILEHCTRSFLDDPQFKSSIATFESYDQFYSFCHKVFN